MPDTLRAEQSVFDATGGLHAAGLFTADGAVLAVREDIGRHNYELTYERVSDRPGPALFLPKRRHGVRAVVPARPTLEI
uniref:formate dehydrogenase accessory sulfurtransferase FdhD n=1 Tax=Nocardia cyriacigeorgica TaxID=135487 RepID=UPI0024547689